MQCDPGWIESSVKVCVFGLNFVQERTREVSVAAVMLCGDSIDLEDALSGGNI